MSKRSYVEYDTQYELLIPGYPKGSDITILNTTYVGRTRDEEGNLTVKDFISILFRDNRNGSKRVFTIQEPKYTFFVLKEKYAVPDNNLFFIDKNMVEPCTCKYADLLRALAEVTNNEQFYRDNISNSNSSENKKLHTCPEVFMSDMNIENYYRFLFSLSYKNEPFKLSKGFMDIETDISYCDNQFPEPGQVPINAIAYCDEASDTVYQFIFNDPRNPLVEKYKQSIENGNVLDELHNFVIQAVGGRKKAIKYKCDKLKYVIKFYDDELELIEKIFKVVHTTIPDFIEFWNWGFDLNYIIARIEELGADPLDIICDPRINPKYLKFFVDMKNKNNYEERGDYASISSYTVYMDQMIQFASRRKGRGRYQSFKLDAIGEVVADVNKLDYSHITNNLGNLPYLDMKTFSFYNVMDVIVQKCIETNTQDLEYIFTKCLVNNTIYPKGHRQSVYLTNRFSKDFYEYGYIIGNNTNKWNEKPLTKFPGAQVGDPTHNSEDICVYINGRPTLIFDNDVDFD